MCFSPPPIREKERGDHCVCQAIRCRPSLSPYPLSPPFPNERYCCVYVRVRIGGGGGPPRSRKKGYRALGPLKRRRRGVKWAVKKTTHIMEEKQEIKRKKEKARALLMDNKIECCHASGAGQSVPRGRKLKPKVVFKNVLTNIIDRYTYKN